MAYESVAVGKDGKVTFELVVDETKNTYLPDPLAGKWSEKQVGSALPKRVRSRYWL